METTPTNIGSKKAAPPVETKTWDVKWDFLKLQEPTGMDAASDEKLKAQILGALDEGFEPFAVAPMIVKKSTFGNDVAMCTWIYFKRPTQIVGKVDESERIIK